VADADEVVLSLSLVRGRWNTPSSVLAGNDANFQSASYSQRPLRVAPRALFGIRWWSTGGNLSALAFRAWAPLLRPRLFLIRSTKDDEKAIPPAQ